MDLPAGEYDGQQTATLTAVSEDEGAKLVYTTDGSDPTASSTAVASGTTINIPTGSTTLKVGLLKNGSVSSIISRQYDISTFEPYNIDIYVNTDAVGWNNVNFWTWGGDGSHSPANSAWPGDKVTATVNVEGKNWYKKNYSINSATDCINFVFSTGTGSPQTVDINDINATTFFEISTNKDGSKHLVNVVETGIKETISPTLPTDNDAIYTLDGRLVRRNASLTGTAGLPAGLYIMGHRKVVVR